MGRRGPVPQPSAVLRLPGAADPAPVSSGGAPTCPPWLSEEAAAEWDRVLPDLDRLGLLDAVDSTALGIYCQAVTDHTELVRDIRVRGWLVDGDRGKVKNPAAQLARELRETILAFSREFGLTPAGRGKLKVGTGPATADTLGAFASRKDPPEAASG